jgi:hypothetical protein
LNQHLYNHDFENAVDVVKHLGAVQAQDYYTTLWNIGMRMKDATEASVDAEVNTKKIVRTWPMRGTIHYVLPENVRWMLKYFESKIKRKMQSYYKKSDLTDALFLKVRKILEKELSGGKALTRDEIYASLNDAKIDTKNVRGLFMLGQNASDGVICCGARRGKQQTFVLLEEWVKPYPDISKDEALQKMALLYFTSHGPAQIKDFAWWAGLTIGEAKIGLELNKNKLIEEIVEGKSYWMKPFEKKIRISNKAYLLGPYDEFTVAYKDRSDISPGSNNLLSSANGFWSSMILDGQVVGMWRRTLDKKKVNIQMSSVRKLSKDEKKLFETEAEKFGKFIGLGTNVSIQV